MFTHIKHHSSSKNVQNPKLQILEHSKKLNLCKHFFRSKTLKISNFENNFYFKFNIIWYMCGYCSIIRIWHKSSSSFITHLFTYNFTHHFRHHFTHDFRLFLTKNCPTTAQSTQMAILWKILFLNDSEIYQSLNILYLVLNVSTNHLKRFQVSIVNIFRNNWNLFQFLIWC